MAERVPAMVIDMERRVRSSMRFCLLWLACAVPAFAADLELRYAALERFVAHQLFTQDGRRYVKGTPKAKCDYAYLEAPHFSAVDKAEGRLKIDAKFSGRSSLDVFGSCMGLGDSFDVTIRASPVARKGVIAMDNVEVTTVKDSYYIRRVRQALTRSFSKDFKIDIRDQAKALLVQPRPNSGYQQELDGFDLSDVRVTPDALVLVVEFKLVVK
jgi:hypothetical protein